MKKYIPILISIFLVSILSLLVYNIKNSKEKEIEKEFNVGDFKRVSSGVRYPYFLYKYGITPPIAIDLSQQRFKGIAFLFGKGLRRVIHKKSWERFDYFGSYALDRDGNLFLTPMPFISIKPTTFNLQKNIYKLDSKNGKLSIWKNIDEVIPSPTNPFGIIAIEYDIKNHSLFISAIDKSDYNTQRGRLYYIDIKTKKILQKIEGYDLLSLKLIDTNRGTFLLGGSARENIVYAFEINKTKISKVPKKLFSLYDINERARKITIYKDNHLLIKTIPFSYNLIAQTQNGSIRKSYDFSYDKNISMWKLFFK